MGSTCAIAWINMMYDFEAEARETNPPSEISKVHNINSQRYFVVAGSDVILPHDILGVKYESSDNYSIRPQNIDINKVRPKEKIKVTLIQKIRGTDIKTRVRDERKVILSDYNHWTFKSGELEKILENAKSEFLKKLESVGIGGVREKIYFELEAQAPPYGMVNK